YNAANNALVQTWTPGDDANLGNVNVELSSEDVRILARSPSTLTATVTQGKNSSAQDFEVWNAVSGTLNYTIADNATWLSVGTASGSSTGEHDSIQVNYATSGLASGIYNATIEITANEASGSPQTISVTLTVSPPPTLSVTPITPPLQPASGG